MAAFDLLEDRIIKYLMPHKKTEMRKGKSLKKAFCCREKECSAKVYLTLIGRVNRFLKKEYVITNEFNYWLMQFHKGAANHKETAH
jgi:hypothetical protein